MMITTKGCSYSGLGYGPYSGLGYGQGSKMKFFAPSIITDDDRFYYNDIRINNGFRIMIKYRL